MMKKKYMEGLLEQTDGQLNNLEQMVIDVNQPQYVQIRYLFHYFYHVGNTNRSCTDGA